MASRILVIDGESGVREVIRDVLEAAGHEVSARDEGKAGVDAALSLRPDLILLDRDMPARSGLDALQSILAADPRAKIVILNRRVDPEAEIAFRRAGARIFLSKTAGIEALLRVVGRALQPPGLGAFGGGWRVLIVDDDPSVRRALKQFLDRKGFAAVAVESGFAGLEMFRVQKPELVVLDVNMPKLNGVETLRRIRRLDANIPVLMVTAQEDFDTALECLRLGAFDYMVKPVNLDFLESSIRGKLIAVAA